MRANGKTPKRPKRQKPYAMVGAGELVSTIWKSGDCDSGWRYGFNLFRLAADGTVRQKFSPENLEDLVKLVQVLAATLADDGCLSRTVRHELTRLAAELDAITDSGG